MHLLINYSLTVRSRTTSLPGLCETLQRLSLHRDCKFDCCKVSCLAFLPCHCLPGPSTQCRDAPSPRFVTVQQLYPSDLIALNINYISDCASSGRAGIKSRKHIKNTDAAKPAINTHQSPPVSRCPPCLISTSPPPYILYLAHVFTRRSICV